MTRKTHKAQTKVLNQNINNFDKMVVLNALLPIL